MMVCLDKKIGESVPPVDTEERLKWLEGHV